MVANVAVEHLEACQQCWQKRGNQRMPRRWVLGAVFWGLDVGHWSQSNGTRPDVYLSGTTAVLSTQGNGGFLLEFLAGLNDQLFVVYVEFQNVVTATAVTEALFAIQILSDLATCHLNIEQIVVPTTKDVVCCFVYGIT